MSAGRDHTLLPAASAAQYLGLSVPAFKRLVSSSMVLMESRVRWRRCRHSYAWPVWALDEVAPHA